MLDRLSKLRRKPSRRKVRRLSDEWIEITLGASSVY